ncbi:MAG: glycoside hydrolase family 3 C-terminal domain-containing protein [Oscillospiraceae bacterium]|nr:glycoside hydrolase family 3 C-terminal domain-containing protein [Oscillospiraceae bacterium]
MDIKKIVSEMTLEEKAGLCSGKNYWETKPVERLGIPSILMTDGPHGLRKIVSGPESGERHSVPATCFPPAVLSACSFDRELLKEMGEAIADECIAENISIVLGPGVNIKRSPLCGRNFEYFSEDPYLAGEMATSFIKGVQSKGVGTSLKHYAANNQETRRWSSDSQIDERTLREIYLPAFKKAVEDAAPATVMCSYNRVNGEYASESYRLLTEILRDEWGFEGIVVSDWGAVNDRVKGIIAGLELEMPGVAEPSNDEYIIKAVRSGELPEATLDLAVERLLNVILDLSGDKRHCGKYRSGENRKIKSTDVKALDPNKHNALARKIASESMVLLKNDKKLLPLNKEANIAFIGEFAEKPRYQGAGSSQVNPISLTTALLAAKEYADIKYCKGYNINKCDEPDDALQAEAVAIAETADVCVLFIGLPPAYESEGFDRTHMRLPEGQNSLIEAVADVNENVVVVLHNGSPVEMPWSDKVSAILEAYLGGQAGGGAIADILFGTANPCGKLAESMPVKLSDNPSYLYYIGEHDVTEYREGIFVGYRYYDTKEMNVLFPFGHGLSYTTFKYSNLRLNKSSIKDTDKLEVTADITNTGTVAGKEIIQLYVGLKEKDDRLIRADKELRDFIKVTLEPGETKTISFTPDKSAFTYYNTKLKDFHVLSGVYKIMLGRSSCDIAAMAEVSVESTVKLPFIADVNTTVRDIVRMEGSEEFLNELKNISPMYARIDTNPEPGSLEYMHVNAIPEMVLRQVRLMGQVPGKSLEDIQKLIDEKLNN